MIKPEHPEEHPTEEEIDETLEETFPASDPPGWTLGVERPAAFSQEDARRTEETVRVIDVGVLIGHVHPKVSDQASK
jgi:hypothetical protein